MAVIELAQPGLEATTYELIITVGNACGTINSIIGTQLMAPFKATGCTVEPCDYSKTTDINSVALYEASDGPARFTKYCIVLIVISVVNVCIWVWYLPSSKQQCKEWKEEGERKGGSVYRGALVVFMASFMIAYGFAIAILLLDPKTACLGAVGGTGCP